MAKSRDTQLAEHRAPSNGAHAVPWDDSDTPCSSFHVNGVAGLIAVEFMDGSTASLYVEQGKHYDYHIKSFKDTATTPDIIYFDV